MKHFNPDPQIKATVLATDLDGTLIPLPENHENVRDLERLRDHYSAHEHPLIFATGRHYESAVDAIEQYNLLWPDYLICDVGTAIYVRQANKLEKLQTYTDHLSQNTAGVNRIEIVDTLSVLPNLSLQADEYQQQFKISFQCDSSEVDSIVEKITEKLEVSKLPYACVGSVDPFLDCGLIDVMPKGVSKAYALQWLCEHTDLDPNSIVYSGDSGNDLAALVHGFRAVVVENGGDKLRALVKKRAKDQGFEKRIYCADGKATSGVLEGCQHFGLFGTSS